MKTETANEQQGKPSLGNLTTGNWIIIVAGYLFIVSLFLPWASTGGFFKLVQKGIGFMRFSSGLPRLNILTLLAAIGCILLCIPFQKRQNRAKYKVIPVIQIILSILGLLPFILLPLQLKKWEPPGQIEIGGWLAIVAALGLLIGAILTLTEIRHQ
jgi:hypothetical protein